MATIYAILSLKIKAANLSSLNNTSGKCVLATLRLKRRVKNIRCFLGRIFVLFFLKRKKGGALFISVRGDAIFTILFFKNIERKFSLFFVYVGRGPFYVFLCLQVGWRKFICFLLCR